MKRESCLVPPVECNPGKSTVIGVDTSKTYPGNIRYHIDQLPSPINSDENENAIYFFNKYLSILSKENRTHSDTLSIGAQRMVTSSDAKRTPIVGLPEGNSGAPAYCTYENRLYYTSKAPNDDPNDYDIYSSRVSVTDNKMTLSDTKAENILNKQFTFDGQPTISGDGLSIIFASDRVGGYGGVDLWYSKRKTTISAWEEPKNMGSQVSTACDEISPSFSQNGKTLFFSSNGHETVGGYDLFSVSLEHDSTAGSRNLGYPVNTTFDEIFPCEVSDTEFYFTSNEPASFAGRNIFLLHRSRTDSKSTTPSNPIVLFDSVELSGQVILPLLSNNLPEVFVRDVILDSEIARKNTDILGNYSFRVQTGRPYDIGAETKDKFYDVHRMDLRAATTSSIPVPLLHVPDTLVLRINFPFDDDSNPYDFVIDDHGGKTETRWQTSMDLLAKSISNSSVLLDKVLLFGHTDSIGTDAYNFSLSKRRAEFVKNQLRLRGVDPNIISVIAKGRSMPIPRMNGESDDNFYLRCRRVEFIKVFKTVKSR